MSIDYRDFIESSRDVMQKYEINTPERQKQFLAHMSHESAGFTALKEKRSDASAEAKYGHRTRVGKILGNTQPGDGARYKGRGYTQLTGRYNYQKVGQLIGRDLVNNPELLEDPEVAKEASAAYWKWRGLNERADKGDIRITTKRLNGGYNGLEDRMRRYKEISNIGTEANDALFGARDSKVSIVKRSPEEMLFGPTTAPSRQEFDTGGPLREFAAGFQRESSVVQGYRASTPGKGISRTVDPEHNPYSNPLNEKYLENFGSEFENSPNAEWDEAIRTKIDEDIDNRMRQQEGGMGAFMGSIAGGIFSYGTLYPGVGLASKAVLGGKLASRAAKFAGMTAATVGVDEGILQQTDPTRETAESVTNMVGAAALGGLIGGIIGKNAIKGGPTLHLKGAAEELGGNSPTVKVDMSNGKILGIEKEGLAYTNKAFKYSVNALKETNPGLRGLTSDVAARRKFTSQLANHNYILVKNLEGVRTDVPAEALIQVTEGRAYGNVSKIYAAKAEMKKAGSVGADSFDNLLMNHLKTGVEPADKILRKAYKAARDQIEYLAQGKKNHGLLDEAVDIHKRFPQLVDAEQVYLKRNEFVDTLRKGFQKAGSTSDEALHKAEKALKRVLDRRDSDLTDLKVAEGTLDDFLINEADQYIFALTRKEGPQVAFRDAGLSGTSLSKEISTIRSEFLAKIDAAKGTKAKTLIKNRMEKEIKDFEALRDVVLRRYGRPTDPYSFGNVAERAIMNITYAARLPGVAISQIPDVARLLATKTFSGAIGKEIHVLGKAIQTAKISKKDLKMIGIGLDMETSARAIELGGVDDVYRTATKVDKFFSKMSNTIGNISGMNIMNDINRRIAGVNTAASMLKDIELWKAGKLSNRMVTEFKRLGIGEEHIDLILGQMKKHGETVDGVFTANLHKWNRQSEIFHQALRRHVDSIIVMPGAADKALWMSKGVGRLLSQFKSFGFAMTNKVMLPGLQKADQVFLLRTMTQIALGAVTFLTKAAVAGREIKDSDLEPSKLILEGIDRSGVTGYLLDVHNMFERVTGMGLSQVIGEQSSRYSHRGKFSALFGPAVGLAEDVIGSIPGVIKGRPTPGEIDKLYRAIPGTQLPYIKVIDNIFNN